MIAAALTRDATEIVSSQTVGAFAALLLVVGPALLLLAARVASRNEFPKPPLGERPPAISSRVMSVNESRVARGLPPITCDCAELAKHGVQARGCHKADICERRGVTR